VSTLLLILVPFALVVLGAVAVLVFTGRLAEQHAAQIPGRGRRPWWGNPLLWVGVCAAFALVGLVVAPRLFGVAFLLLPFIWIGGFRRRRQG